VHLIDIARLPLPQALEALDFETVLAALIADYCERFPHYTAILESDPSVKLLEVATWRETVIRARINDAYKAGMLSFAADADLDHVGAFHSVTRLEGEADTPYRARIQQGYWRIAAAGPASAFVSHARGAHPQVLDAEAWAAAPGSVQLAVLAAVTKPIAGLSEEEQERYTALADSAFHTLPSIDTASCWVPAEALDEPMQAARQAVTAADVLPLGMEIGVRPAEIIEFRIAARLVLYPGTDDAMVLQEARARLDTHLKTVARIKYDVTRAALIAALAVEGVQNVLLDSPAADVVCGHGQLALALSRTLTIEAERDV